MGAAEPRIARRAREPRGDPGHRPDRRHAIAGPSGSRSRQLPLVLLLALLAAATAAPSPGAAVPPARERHRIAAVTSWEDAGDGLTLFVSGTLTGPDGVTCADSSVGERRGRSSVTFFCRAGARSAVGRTVALRVEAVVADERAGGPPVYRRVDACSARRTVPREFFSIGCRVESPVAPS